MSEIEHPGLAKWLTAGNGGGTARAIAAHLTEIDALTHTAEYLSEGLAKANARADRAEAERDVARIMASHFSIMGAG